MQRFKWQQNIVDAKKRLFDDNPQRTKTEPE